MVSPVPFNSAWMSYCEELLAQCLTPSDFSEYLFRKFTAILHVLRDSPSATDYVPRCVEKSSPLDRFSLPPYSVIQHLLQIISCLLANMYKTSSPKYNNVNWCNNARLILQGSPFRGWKPAFCGLAVISKTSFSNSIWPLIVILKTLPALNLLVFILLKRLCAICPNFYPL